MARIGSGERATALGDRRRGWRRRGAAGSPANAENGRPGSFSSGFGTGSEHVTSRTRWRGLRRAAVAGAGLAEACGGAQLRRARAVGGEREGGEKGVGELPCYLAKLWGGELGAAERRSGETAAASKFPSSSMAAHS